MAGGHVDGMLNAVSRISGINRGRAGPGDRPARVRLNADRPAGSSYLKSCGGAASPSECGRNYRVVQARLLHESLQVVPA